MGDYGIIYLIMAAALLGGGGVGYWLATRGRIGLACLLAAIPTVAAAIFFLMSLGKTGWDALGYFLIAIVFCGPPMIGLWLGTLIGWLRYRRTRRLGSSGPSD